jgi:hypothetical protein
MSEAMWALGGFIVGGIAFAHWNGYDLSFSFKLSPTEKAQEDSAE